MKERLVIIDGLRTPFCKMGTYLSDLSADELGRTAVNALIHQTGIDPNLIDEVIFGCVGQPPETANIARVIALRAGIPHHVPAYTVHRNCASGLEAFTQAYEKMAARKGNIFIVGGTESMSNVPFLFHQKTAKKFTALSRSKTALQQLKAILNFKLRDFSPRIGLKLGLTDPVCGLNMGETAEVLSRKFSISRQEQDQFALESHLKAAAATTEAFLDEEIIPVFLNSERKNVVEKDNGVRQNQTLVALENLKPIFEPKTGTVTAGNASQVTDGAVALLVMSEAKAQELNLEPLGILTGYEYAGCAPSEMGLGPAYAMAKADKNLGLNPEEADLIEINEAFAAQVLAVLKAVKSEKFAQSELNRKEPLACIDTQKLNVNGGAIALGHPVGATGARLVLTALKELKRKKQNKALVSLCVGGGQGAAVWLER